MRDERVIAANQGHGLIDVISKVVTFTITQRLVSGAGSVTTIQRMRLAIGDRYQECLTAMYAGHSDATDYRFHEREIFDLIFDTSDLCVRPVCSF